VIKIAAVLIAAAAPLAIGGCQSVSFADGYKANNCAMTGTSCSPQSRKGTV